MVGYYLEVWFTFQLISALWREYIILFARQYIDLRKRNKRKKYEAESYDGSYTIEPDAETIVTMTIPLILDGIVHETLLEAKASEHAARMVAMKNAKDSANKKATWLTLIYNKTRQAAITKEVSEIVSGVESMKDS